VIGKMEQLLSLWVDESNEINIPHTQSAICEKAKSLFDNIKEKEGSDDFFLSWNTSH
jgi:hypothetical protein